jgi:hypothetical protein
VKMYFSAELCLDNLPRFCCLRLPYFLLLHHVGVRLLIQGLVREEFYTLDFGALGF